METLASKSEIQKLFAEADRLHKQGKFTESREVQLRAVELENQAAEEKDK